SDTPLRDFTPGRPPPLRSQRDPPLCVGASWGSWAAGCFSGSHSEGLSAVLLGLTPGQGSLAGRWDAERTGAAGSRCPEGVCPGGAFPPPPPAEGRAWAGPGGGTRAPRPDAGGQEAGERRAWAVCFLRHPGRSWTPSGRAGALLAPAPRLLHAPPTAPGGAPGVLMAAEPLTELEAAIETVVTTFFTFAGQEGRKGSLSVSEFRELATQQLPHLLKDVGSLDEKMKSLDVNQDSELKFHEYWRLIGELAKEIRKERALEIRKK
uniref:S100/CaBP-9k-type calcium binding subdomain domain-containing protein n=2 Tax=Ursus americanus TaxID=9643 RepID=A0A452QG83_URSAM